MRLLEACRTVPTFDKLGSNDNYNYVFASQIFEKFRAELMVRDILLLPDEKDVIEKDIPTVAGPTLRQITLHVDYELIDCRGVDPPIVKHAIGVGMDNGDKAIYKAKTGALKYFFRVLGIIPWNERDDPEYDSGIDDQTDPKVYQERKKVKRIASKQQRAFDSACHRSGKTAQQIADFLKTQFDIATVADLSTEDFNAAIKWASLESNSVDLTDVIRMSAELATESQAKKKVQPIVAVMDQQIDDEVATGD
jgi:hypothetical protein